MPTYNKLVRDNIPEVIRNSGKEFSARILDIDEYNTELKKKIGEELAEYTEAKTNEDAVEELADMLELIHAATKMHGATLEQLEEVRRAKAEKRGSFDQRIFLIEVEDD